MKKNNTYFLIFIALFILTALLLFLKLYSPTDWETEFSVQDISAVQRIELSDKYGQHVSLQKKNNMWYVGNYPAKNAAVETLLETLQKIKVAYAPPATAKNNVLKNITSSGVKTSLYTAKGKLLKTIYVGGTPPAMDGTFMLLEKDGVVASEPYVVNISGFRGTLQPRFTTDEVAWKSRAFFGIPAEKIAQVSVSYFGDNAKQDKSYSITVGDGFAKVTPLSKRTEIQKPANKQQVIQTVMTFSNLSFEGYELEDSNKLKVKTLPPIAVISVQPKKGKKIVATIYPMPIHDKSRERYAADGKPLTYDTERVYATVNGDKDLVVAQYLVLNTILKWYDSFFE